MNNSREGLLLVSDVTCEQAQTIGTSTRASLRPRERMRPGAKVCKRSGTKY